MVDCMFQHQFVSDVYRMGLYYTYWVLFFMLMITGVLDPSIA